MFGVKVGIFNVNNEDPGSYWERKYPGTPVFDAYFDMSPVENQHRLDKVCGELLAFEEIIEVECPIWQLKGNSTETQFPMLPKLFNESMIAYVNEFSAK